MRLLTKASNAEETEILILHHGVDTCTELPLQMATSSHSPSENQPAAEAPSSSPGCSTSAAGISQILRGKLVQGAVISPNSGMIRTPTPGHPNYSPSSHLKSSYVST